MNDKIPGGNMLKEAISRYFSGNKKALCFIVIVMFSIPLYAQTHVSGNVSGEWTIAGSPYIVDGDIIIETSDSLYVEPGVSVIFSDHYIFDIQGRLIAEGTEDGIITFTAENPEIGWGGLRFHHTNDNGQEPSHLRYCVLEYGKATPPESDGGAIFLDNSDEIFEFLTLQNNSATGYGGGMYILNSSPTLYYVRIIDNSALYDGGGIFCFSGEPTLTRVTLAGNITQWSGGGIACYNNSDLSFVNVTISQNTAWQNGGGIACLFNSSIEILNSIVWDNGAEEIYVVSTGEATIKYSDIMNGINGINGEGDAGINWLEGNLQMNPFFVNPSTHDYNLQATSPCIDTGNPDPIYNDPDGSRNDMGAYWFHQTGLRGTVTFAQGVTGNVEDVLISVQEDTTVIDTVHPWATGDYFIGVAPGIYTVTAALEGFYPNPPSYQNVEVGEGELVSGLDFEMDIIHYGNVKGKVALGGDTQDPEIPNVEIFAENTDYSTHPYFVDTPYPGYYEYNLELPPGTYEITAHLSGFYDSTYSDIYVFPNQTTSDIDFDLQPLTYEGYVSGTVTLQDGPGNVEDVIISAPGAESVNPDADGHYLLTIASGTHNITASLEGYAPVTIRDVHVLPDQTTTGIDMILINWDVIDGTQFTMIVYATVSHEGKFLYGVESNQLGVFGPDGENDCRGIAQWQLGNHQLWDTDYYYWDLPGYWYVTVASNNNSGTDSLHFKAYDTATDSIYTCPETIIFEDCTINQINLTAPSNPQTQEFDLVQNWNWISFYLFPENNLIDSLFSELTPDDIYQIKNQTQISTYFTPGGWTGDLEYVFPGVGYLVYMKNPVDNFTIQGFPINPIINPIELNQDWTWIGYSLPEPLPLASALESVTGNATCIKTQEHSAIYWSGQWIGDLAVMEPGKGYKIFTENEGNLVYPLPDSKAYDIGPIVVDMTKQIPQDWQILTGTQENMIVIATIFLGEKTIIGGKDYIVGIFDKYDNCRSIGYPFNDFWYFTVVGNEIGEELHCKLYERDTGTVLESENFLTFEKDITVGTPQSPTKININGSYSNNIFKLKSIYPNPCKELVSISYIIPEQGYVELAIYNIKGQRVETLVSIPRCTEKEYTVHWNTEKFSPGIYFVKLTWKGNSEVRKFVVIQ